MEAIQIAVPILILALQAVVLIAELRYGQWREISTQETETDGFGPSYFARSQIECGIKCSNHPGCYMYCYANFTSTCYVKTRTSSGSTLSEDEAVKCYKHGCPSMAGYFPYGGRCIQLFTNKSSYRAARQRCEQDGAHLYHFKTSDDRQPLIDLMRDNGYNAITKNTPVWIGADDAAEEDHFVWSDGDVLPSDSDLWRDTDPSGGQGKEDCVEVQPEYLFNDRRCSDRLFYICQLNLSE